MAARATGLRLIILYKGIKAALQLMAAGALFYGVRHGLTASLAVFAAHLRAHAVHAWSASAAGALDRFTDQPRDLVITGVALAGDAVLSGVEGWVLARGYNWGPWLVVGATGGLLPFELVSIARHPHAGRILLFVLNAAIVGYLVSRARRARISRGTSADALTASYPSPGSPPRPPQRSSPQQ